LKGLSIYLSLPTFISGLTFFSRFPNQPLRLSLSVRRPELSENVLSHLNETDLRHLASKGYIIKPNFLSPLFVRRLRDDIDLLRAKGLFKAAKIGQDATNTLNTRIRVAETCFIGESKLNDEPSNTRNQLFQILENLRSLLSANNLLKCSVDKAAPTLDPRLSEFLYAYYSKGGFYRRHLDSVPNSASFLRAYSILVYLNENWSESDGGCLRMHFDTGREFLPSNEEPNYIDVKPEAGTLVLFDSQKIPHEVLDTSSKRSVVVGWYNKQFSAADIVNVVPENENKRVFLMTIAAALVTTGIILLLKT